jgi:23S rRNA (uracil1939-C5)-methyltransferase
MNVELAITYVGLMGQGVAHDTEGNIYFVPGALPGDRILARSEGTKKYRDAELVEILTPSPDRITPDCAFFKDCGGCDWLDWKYPAQLKAKETVLRHVLERGQWQPQTFLPTIAADQPFGYRNRIQLRSDGKRLGFYKRKSHDIVDIESCSVAHPKLNEALGALRTELAGNYGDQKVELAVQPDGSLLRLDNQPHAAAGFAQVHDAQNERLRQEVTALVKRAGGESVLELFAGNGNFTLAYAEAVKEIFAIDLSAAALAQARAGFGGKKEPRIAFIEARVDARLVRRLPSDFRTRYDTLLLDPPRAGAEGCLAPLVHDGLKTIIYVSCSPVAFTKDVQCLKESFQFDQVQIVDMFPHTRHIEFIAYFSRLPC